MEAKAITLRVIGRFVPCCTRAAPEILPVELSHPDGRGRRQLPSALSIVLRLTSARNPNRSQLKKGTHPGTRRPKNPPRRRRRTAGLNFFTCPNCLALYQIVKAKAGPETVFQETPCRVRGEAIVGREGNFVLKYYLLREAARVRPWRRASEKSPSQIGWPGLSLLIVTCVSNSEHTHACLLTSNVRALVK